MSWSSYWSLWVHDYLLQPLFQQSQLSLTSPNLFNRDYHTSTLLYHHLNLHRPPSLTASTQFYPTNAHFSSQNQWYATASSKLFCYPFHPSFPLNLFDSTIYRLWRPSFHWAVCVGLWFGFCKAMIILKARLLRASLRSEKLFCLFVDRSVNWSFVEVGVGLLSYW